jgi:2-(1,2-epoxy-1,2-dihydrophenyl)acetyl-CoA isomerase
MTYANLLAEIRGNVAHITINRPEARNSIDLATAKELAEVALSCREDSSVRAVIITGQGSTFSVGGDVKAFATEKDLPLYLEKLTTYLHTAISHFVRMEAPVITAVNGMAAGAGLSLACIGDLTLAAESARFVVAYSKIGLTPDGSCSYFLPRIIGLKKALELALTNRMLSAQEALDWGIVTRLIPDAELFSEAEVIAAQLASGATKALGVAKQLLHDGWMATLEVQMQHESTAISDISRTADAQEGIAAFVEKRPPGFRGR